MLSNHYGRFYQNSDNSAILEQKLNNPKIQAGQGIASCYNKMLTPFPFTSPDGKSRTGLKGKIGGGIKRCDCGHYWVNTIQTGDVTTWHCEKCHTPRLAQRPKTDIELISELIGHPDLKGWDGTFLREMQRGRGGLGRKQREKLRSIAQKLGAKMSQACSIFDQSTH